MNRNLPRRTLPWIPLAALAALSIGFAGCSRAANPWKDAKPGQKKVLVTFPALYCLTQPIAGDDAYVLCFLSTQDPHEYASHISPADAQKARGADLLISNGLGLDDKFVERMLARHKVLNLEVGEALPEDMLLDLGKEDEHDHDHNHGEKGEKGEKADKAEKDDHHHHGAHDPHVWLGPPQAMKAADAIAAKLGEIDKDHAEDYKRRAEKLKGELQKLWDDGRQQFAAKKGRRILTMHESTGYFAKAFGLEVVGSIQPQPGQDPDAAWMAQLQKLCKDKHVDVITYEPQYSKAQPDLLQKQLNGRGVDVRLAEFDTLETAPLAAGGVNPDPGYYFEKMRANIDNLAKAMP
jgi:zinc transport system substrate-binding protein